MPYVRAFTYYNEPIISHLFVKLHAFIIIIDMNVTYPQFYHDLITMRGAMPTHLGTNPHNHVKHNSCSFLDFFLLLLINKIFQEQ